MSTTNSFSKQERLCSKKQIDALFEKSASRFTASPILFAYRFIDANKNETFPAKAAFTVSKRHFKLAVDRNRIKRQMRECWRLQKASVYEDLLAAKQELHLMLVYTAKEKRSYTEMEKAVSNFREKLSSLLKK